MVIVSGFADGGCKWWSMRVVALKAVAGGGRQIWSLMGAADGGYQGWSLVVVVHD